MIRTLLLMTALVALSACGTGKYGGTTCKPSNQWGAPASKCEKDVEPDLELVAEAEEEPMEELDEMPEEETDEDVVLTEEAIEINDRIQFKTDGAELLDGSKEILDQVAQILEDNPEIAVVRIEGHTDGRGGRRYNRKLSKKRAKAVRRYLIDQGIARDRLTVKGYGERRPMASNGTRRGRYENRRVEIKIVERN